MTLDLIASLQQAKGPSRELDCWIYGKRHWPDSTKWRVASLGRSHPELPFRWSVIRQTVEPHEVIIDGEDIPRFTEIIDMAMTLVGNDWWEMQAGCDGAFYAKVGPWNVPIETIRGYGGATPAIALCIAALKARAAAP